MASLYQASIPPMIKSLQNFSVILTKAADFCIQKDKPASEVLAFRLIEDMRPLSYQVQSCSDVAKALAWRVGGAEYVKMEDTESTFDELQTRITRTIDILQALDPGCMNGKETATIHMETSSMGTFAFNGSDYVFKYALPNFHFHFTSGYCILRHLGVPISAFDYLDTQKDLWVKV